MSHVGRLRLIVAAAFALAAVAAGGAACTKSESQNKPLPAKPGPAAPQVAHPFKNVRQPAWAGSFYPADAAELSKTIQRLLSSAKARPVGAAGSRLRGLVCPHAGYVYSGPVAASGYKLLTGQRFSTVFVLGPSHTAWFQGAYVTPHDGYKTPLGTVGISAKAAQLAGAAPFKVARWQVARPDRRPAADTDTPETYEHSVEVQVPFLQATLKDFQLVPIVCGQADPAELAKAIAPLLDDSTLIVASSDLSHDKDYDLARAIDERTVKAICDLNAAGIEADSRLGGPCGLTPIQTLIHLARARGWKAALLDLRNSGDVLGERSGRIVGYSAIAFYEGQPAPPPAYSHERRKLLLDLARRAVTAEANNQPPPQVDPTTLPEELRENAAAFVTLNKDGALRGCIGEIVASQPLYRSVLTMARQAAAFDHRFSAVVPDELPRIRIEVSVLTRPQRLAFSSPDDLLAKLRPHVDGVILTSGNHRGLFLPQVWDAFADKEKFLNELAWQKAHLAPDAWRRPGVVIEVFQAECFDESEF